MHHVIAGNLGEFHMELAGQSDDLLPVASFVGFSFQSKVFFQTSNISCRRAVNGRAGNIRLNAAPGFKNIPGLIRRGAGNIGTAVGLKLDDVAARKQEKASSDAHAAHIERFAQG